MWVNCIDQKHNTMKPARTEPGSFNLESNYLEFTVSIMTIYLAWKCFFYCFQSISIPLRKADSGDDNTAEFQLDCSAIQSGGRQGGMDCIQQPGGSSDIRTVGTITHKINVKATDDSYQMTQQRMKEAEEERKGVRYSKYTIYVNDQCWPLKLAWPGD